MEETPKYEKEPTKLVLLVGGSLHYNRYYFKQHEKFVIVLDTPIEKVLNETGVHVDSVGYKFLKETPHGEIWTFEGKSLEELGYQLEDVMKEFLPCQ